MKAIAVCTPRSASRVHGSTCLASRYPMQRSSSVGYSRSWLRASQLRKRLTVRTRKWGVRLRPDVSCTKELDTPWLCCLIFPTGAGGASEHCCKDFHPACAFPFFGIFSGCRNHEKAALKSGLVPSGSCFCCQEEPVRRRLDLLRFRWLRLVVLMYKECCLNVRHAGLPFGPVGSLLARLLDPVSWSPHRNQASRRHPLPMCVVEITMSGWEHITTCCTVFAPGTTTTFWTSSCPGWITDLHPERTEKAEQHGSSSRLRVSFALGDHHISDFIETSSQSWTASGLDFWELDQP